MSFCHRTRGWKFINQFQIEFFYFFLHSSVDYYNEKISIETLSASSLKSTFHSPRNLFTFRNRFDTFLFGVLHVLRKNFWSFLNFNFIYFIYLVYQSIFPFFSRPKWLFSNDHDEPFCPLEYQPISISDKTFQIWSCCELWNRLSSFVLYQKNCYKFCATWLQT